MTSVDRAKRFLENKGRTIALTIVPLAALVAIAQPARATLHLNPGVCDTSTGQTCQLNPLNGGSSLSADLFTASGGGGLSLSALGSVAGTPSGGQTIPFTWSFTFSDTGGDLSYDLNATLFGIGTSGSFDTGTVDVSGTSATITGGVALSPVGLIPLTGWSTEIDVEGSASGTLLLDVPADSSLDINVAPEPATFGLLGSALAGLGALAFWRRKKS